MSDNIYEEDGVIVTRYSGGTNRERCYQLNDITGNYVNYTRDEMIRVMLSIVGYEARDILRTHKTFDLKGNK